MQSDQALRYLLLKHLWKLRVATDRRAHAEVATSLAVDRRESTFIVSWTRLGQAQCVEAPAERFVFYKRGDVPARDGSPPTAGGHDNEMEARKMAAEMLGVRVPQTAIRPAESLYLDTWRWPLLCGVAGLAAMLTSRSLMPVAFAASALAESKVRSYWLYLPWVATLVVYRFTVSAVVLGTTLAGIAWLAGTSTRARAGALAYLAVAFVGWYLRSESPSPSVAWPAVLVSGLVAAAVWTVFWLSYEGPRLSILIAPTLAVLVLVAGHRDLALGYLAASLVYAAWLTLRARRHAN